MTTKVILDRTALTALIESDPDFKLEVQKHILNDVMKNVFLKNIDSAMLKAAPIALVALHDDAFISASIAEALEKRVAAPKNYQKSARLTPEVQAIIDIEVDNAVAKITKSVASEVHSSYGQLVEDWLTSNDAVIAARVEKHLERRVGEEVERRVDDRVRKILDGLKAS